MSGRSLSEIDRAGWVFTPGGPRPRANVHEVNPGDVIIHDRGTGGSTIFRAANAAGSEAGARSVEELVITPGGARPRSQVHEVQSGAVITAARVGHHATGEDATRPDRLARATLRLARNTFASEDLPALGSGYITYAAWTNGTGRAISSFSTTWTVPPPPRTQSGQLLYLFNGLEDSPVTHILQPVLQWGVSPNGGGNSWAVASWWVDNSNNATKTPLVQVNPGDILVGVMTLLSQSGGSFSYSCEFSNISGTRMTVQGANQMVLALEALECYRITQCPDYPDVNGTAMTGIDIKAGGVDVTPSWGAVNAVTDCGQHTVVVSNASPGGEVDLFYRPTDWSGVADNWRPIGGFFPPGAPVSSVARTGNNLDLFITGNDGRVYTSWWSAGNDWSGVADNWRPIGGFFPPAPRSPRSPAPGTTWTCSSRATTAGSTPPGGAPATTGRGWPTTGAPSADSSPRRPRSPRSPAPGTTWTCSSRATTAGSTPPGGAPATTGRGWPTTGAPSADSSPRRPGLLGRPHREQPGPVHHGQRRPGLHLLVERRQRLVGGGRQLAPHRRILPRYRPGLLGRPHREQPGPVHHGQRRPGLHLLVERRQRLVGGGRQLAPHRRILPRYRPGLLGRPHREQPGPVHHGQRRPGLHLLVERRQRLVGGGRQLAPHRRILPRYRPGLLGRPHREQPGPVHHGQRRPGLHLLVVQSRIVDIFEHVL